MKTKRSNMNRQIRKLGNITSGICRQQTISGGWYIGGLCPRLKDCLKNEQFAEKQTFEGNWEILRTIFQPRALSSNIAANQEGVYLFYYPPINFFNALYRRKTEKPAVRDNQGII